MQREEASLHTFTFGSITNEGKPLCINRTSLYDIEVDWMLYRLWFCCMAVDGPT